MKKNLITKSLSLVHNYCDKSEYKGYSILDSHTSPIQFKKLGHTISFLINQTVKRSPINIRKIIGVKKTHNPKAMGLFLYAYTLQKKWVTLLELKILMKE